jgi:nucleoside-diphosphate-sugar epimerase
MNIVITGATSASGHAAIRHYAPRGKIFAVGRDQKKLDVLSDQYGVTPIFLDFGLKDQDFLEYLAAVKLPKIDLIIHLCAVIPSTAKSSADFYQVNVINARHFFENVALSENVKILNFSSASVYDMGSQHLHENAPLNFAHDYGLSKYCFERYLEAKIQKLKHDSRGDYPFALNARVPVLLTPNVGSNFISKWRDDLKNGNMVKLFNPESLFNSCVWIGDIFAFFDDLSHENQLTFTTCNVGIQGKATIRETFELLCDAMNVEGITEIVQTDRVAQNYDCTKAESLGFKGSTIQQAIRKFIKT